MDLTTRSDAEILAVVEPIMDRLMAASTAIDYAGHVRDFTPRLLAQLPPERFETLCHAYQTERGTFAGREVVAVFRRPASIAVIWRQGFNRVAGEFVAELVLVEQDGRYLVDHVMVF